jgi:peptidoglycan/xylan/chitin deacetylase (PgdA/CDA1 family)
VLSSIPNKREFLARRLGDLGVLRLLERAGRRPGLLVVTHHRIGDPTTSPYYEPVYSASPEAFRAQLCYLRAHFRMVGPETLGDALSSAEPSVLVAFDDGYRDNFDVAFPILRELGVPAIFFIPTAFLQTPRLPWWDHVAYVIKHSPQTRILLDWPMPLVLELGPPPRTDAIWNIIRLYLDGTITDEPRFRAHLAERAQVAVDELSLGRGLFMSWEQIQTLADSGMAIGSHSHTHRKLAALSEDEQMYELTESRRILEQTLGRAVDTIAYPFGWVGAFGRVTERLAETAGYQLAFSAKPGVNRRANWDPFALRRLSVGSSDTAAIFRARIALNAACGRSFL